jgi:trehalose-6-phosphate synthase
MYNKINDKVLNFNTQYIINQIINRDISFENYRYYNKLYSSKVCSETKHNKTTTFQIFTALLMKIIVFWDTPF